VKLPAWRDAVIQHPRERVARYRLDGLWSGATIGTELCRLAAARPDTLALAGPDRVLTWAELDRETDRIAAGLLATGLRPGDAALLQLDNSVATVLTWYGLIKAAVIPVATLSAHRGHEMREIGRITRARAHIVEGRANRKFDLVGFAERLADEAAEAGGKRRLVLTSGAAEAAGTRRIEDLGADIQADQARAVVARTQGDIDDEDIAVFQLSGGTTGTPKVIPRLHGEYWYNARSYAHRQRWDLSTRVTHFGPLVHNAGIVCALHGVHAVGGAMIVANADPDTLLPAMAKFGVTDLVLFPGLVPQLSRHPRFDDAMAAVRQVTFTVAPVTRELFGQFDGRGITVMGLYGMGEGFCATTSPDDPPEVRRRSVGYELSPQDEVRIVEPGTESLVASGEVGELCCRGPYTIRGYLDAADRNLEAFSPDGFYHTGDLLREQAIDGVRCFTFEGRSKDLINRGGEKIASSEIEGLLAEMPGIHRVALVPVPDERLGERAWICIEPANPTLRFELADIQHFLEQRQVARFKWPEHLEIVAELPLTPVGKVDKKRLAAEVGSRASVAVPPTPTPPSPAALADAPREADDAP
jgi:non-ribosomal peptide synthetase component E (peptide arylation enzyme)